jgi:hypothetical protein
MTLIPRDQRNSWIDLVDDHQGMVGVFCLCAKRRPELIQWQHGQAMQAHPIPPAQPWQGRQR